MRHLNRRRLLQTSAAIAALGSLAACVDDNTQDREPASPETGTKPEEIDMPIYTATSIPDGV